MSRVVPNVPDSLFGSRPETGTVMLRYQQHGNPLRGGFTVRALHDEGPVVNGIVYDSARTLREYVSMIPNPYKVWLGWSDSHKRMNYLSKWRVAWISEECVAGLVSSLWNTSKPLRPLRPMFPNQNDEAKMIDIARKGLQCPWITRVLTLQQASAILGFGGTNGWAVGLDRLFSVIQGRRQSFELIKRGLKAPDTEEAEYTPFDDQMESMRQSESAFLRLLAERLVRRRAVTSNIYRITNAELVQMTKIAQEVVRVQKRRFAIKNQREDAQKNWEPSIFPMHDDSGDVVFDEQGRPKYTAFPDQKAEFEFVRETLRAMIAYHKEKTAPNERYGFHMR